MIITIVDPFEIVVLSCVLNDKSAALTKSMVFEAIENFLNSKLFKSILSCKIKHHDPSFPSKSLGVDRDNTGAESIDEQAGETATGCAIEGYNKPT